MATTAGVIALRGGASLVSFRPLFSKDSRFLFCCCGYDVKVYSITSGECVHRLGGHSRTVTALQLHPKLQNRLLSCSKDGKIIEWDYADGTKLKTHDTHIFMHDFHIVDDEAKKFVIVKKGRNANRSQRSVYEVCLYSLDDKDTTLLFTDLVPSTAGKIDFVGLGANSEYVASIQEMTLNVYSFEKQRSYEHTTYDKPPMTCIACHPTEHCIATGCAQGQILIWRNFLHKKKPVCTSIHWHSLAVQDLAFTREGSYLLSGGYECVLVKWQFETHDKMFLPRLGSPISRIICSQDNSVFATCHTNNGIQVISSFFNVVQIFQGFTQGHTTDWSRNWIPVGFLIDPRTKVLVTNGRPGHLQFYDINRDRHLYNLDIVGQNYVSPDSLDRPLVLTELEGADFSPDGDWLVTLEYRNDCCTSPDMRLKFWKFDHRTQGFVLNTNVNEPHRDKVKMVAFSPATGDERLTVVTTSKDCTFKLWTLTDDTDMYRTRQCWNCTSVGYYKDHKPGPAAFSQDGSVLCVGFGPVLTLWDPQNNALQKTIMCGSKFSDRLKSIQFGRKQCCHLVVCGTSSMLAVWDLGCFEVLWCIDTKMSSWCIDPCSNIMAVFNTQKTVTVYNLWDKNPVYSKKLVSKSAVIACIFVPREKPCEDLEEKLQWSKTSQLFFMNANQELLSIQPENTCAGTVPNIIGNVLGVSDTDRQTTLSTILASNSTKKQLLNDGGLLLGKRGLFNQNIKQLLTSSPNVLPPVTSMCHQFMTSLLVSKNSKASSSVERDSDEEMSDCENSKNAEEDSDASDEMNSVGERPITKESLGGRSHDIVMKVVKSDPARQEDLVAVLDEDMSWLMKKITVTTCPS